MQEEAAREFQEWIGRSPAVRHLARLLFFIALLDAITAFAGQTERPVQVIPMASQDARPVMAATTAIIANRNDPGSIPLATAYAQKRHIPDENIIWVSLPVRDSVSDGEIAPALETIRRKNAAARFKAFAVAWQKPYRLKNQSITAAISMGLSKVRFLGNCNVTDVNPLFGKAAAADLDIPVSMMLVGGPKASDAMSLVEKAGDGDGTNPPGTVYLLRTDDATRSSPRLLSMSAAAVLAKGRIKVELERRNDLANADDVFGYETGRAQTQAIPSLSFLAGGYADSLTSYGGRLDDSHGQTPISAFMKAGATGSYGTVREPCNFPDKFPRPDIMLDRYLSGDSLAEAYWKSVRMITEGLFVGEPLSRPFAIFKATTDGQSFRIFSTRLSKPGHYQLFDLGSRKPDLVGAFSVGANDTPGALVASLPARTAGRQESQPVLGFLSVSDEASTGAGK